MLKPPFTVWRSVAAIHKSIPAECNPARLLSTSSSYRPLKLAIIGAGPSGFYAASKILSTLPETSDKGQDVEIHMYERLPTPYGLVRYGVAPDHPEVKNCQHKFDQLSTDPRFLFFGNVSIGSTHSQPLPSTSTYNYPLALHLPLSALFPYYTTILFTYGSSLSNPLRTTNGSAFSDNPLNNVYPALSFVSWYNGHPAYSHLNPDLSGDEATIIGHGNVAMDCARLLLKDPSSLRETDIPTPVLERLSESRIRRVEAVGRRGPAQVSFTTKEFREMLNLEGVAFEGVDEGLMKDAKRMIEGDRAKGRLLDLMTKGSKVKSAEKSFALGFLKSPKAFLPASSGDHPTKPQVGSIQWSQNSLLAPPTPPPSPLPAPPIEPVTPPQTTSQTAASFVARPTGEEVTTETNLVIESVGYRSEALRMHDGEVGGEGKGWRLPFDERRGRLVNDGGRVVDQDGIMIPGMYTAGWVARGPVGVIASTMQHAYSVAALILSDHFSSSSFSSTSSPLISLPSRGEIPPELRNSGKRVVEMRDWEKIDKAEVERAKVDGKGNPREKFRTVEEMLEVLG